MNEPEMSPFDEAKLAKLIEEVANPKFDEETRKRIKAGEVLPPADPLLYSDHGYGCGPLDGIEDWQQFWGDYDLSVRRRAANAGFTWDVRRGKIDGVLRQDGPWPIVAEGETPTMEEAGQRVLDWCRHA